MNKFIVYQNPNTNNMEILIPCISSYFDSIEDETGGSVNNLNDNSQINEIIKDIPKNQDGSIVKFKVVNSVPKYTEYFDFLNDSIVRNRNKLHNYKKNQWRFIRKGKLEKLDVEFMKSIELNDTLKQNEIKLKKQELRDVTSIDVSDMNDDDLENFIPDILL